MSINFLSLKNRVMVRIYVQYAKDVVHEYPDYFMLGLFMIVSLLSVSIIDVFHNTTGILRNDMFSVFAFIFAAIKNTSIIIQLFMAGFIVRLAIISARFIYKGGANIKWRTIRFRY